MNDGPIYARENERPTPKSTPGMYFLLPIPLRIDYICGPIVYARVSPVNTEL